MTVAAVYSPSNTQIKRLPAALNTMIKEHKLDTKETVWLEHFTMDTIFNTASAQNLFQIFQLYGFEKAPTTPKTYQETCIDHFYTSTAESYAMGFMKHIFILAVSDTDIRNRHSKYIRYIREEIVKMYSKFNKLRQGYSILK